MDLDLFDSCLTGFENVNEANLDEVQEAGLEELVKEVEVFNVSGWVNQNIAALKGMSKEQVLSDFKQMVKHFETFHSSHPDKLSRCKNVVKDLVTKLKLLFPLYPEKILQKFVFKKSMQRMKYIYRTEIRRGVSLRSQIKVVEFVHSQATKPKAPKKKAPKRLKQPTESKKKAKPNILKRRKQ